MLTIIRLRSPPPHPRLPPPVYCVLMLYTRIRVLKLLLPGLVHELAGRPLIIRVQRATYPVPFDAREEAWLLGVDSTTEGKTRGDEFESNVSSGKRRAQYLIFVVETSSFSANCLKVSLFTYEVNIEVVPTERKLLKASRRVKL